jgi:hypothetical protein
MKIGEHPEIASQQLDRVLSFFARVEAKASFIFAVDSALLALVAINVQYGDLTNPPIVAPAAICVLLLCISLFFVYRCSFPNLAGGHRSLVYFKEIAKLREAEYVEQFGSLDAEALARDVMGQIWRNSEILSAKFAAIKIAFILTAVALLPWFIFLVTTSIAHPHLPTFK